MATDLGKRSPFESPVLGAMGHAEIRWKSKADSIAGIEQELGRMWSQIDLSVPGSEEGGARLVSARTSVMNLVVITRRPEIAERAVATIHALTGRHPSRTLLITSADPDGPAWLDARIEAHCVLPREDSPEICAEMVILTAGGEAGRHLSALVTPLVVHDLPVTVWWPSEPLFRSQATLDLLGAADRLVVDGSSWNGDGLDRLRDLAELAATTGIAVSDFALDRQSRWREAIASIFDDPDFTPYLRSIRRIAVTYATHDETGAPGSTNIVKPVYHVAWLASCLGLRVVKPLNAVNAAKRSGSKSQMARGHAATLSDGRAEVGVIVRPVTSPAPAGTTLRVELLAERRGSELRADVTAEKDIVRVRVWQDGVEVLDRSFNATRRTEVELLAQAIEASGRNRLAADALAVASALVAPPDAAA